MSTQLCQITFHMRFQTVGSESVRIIGNLPELGNWDPMKGLVLQSAPEIDSGIWISPEPIKVPKKTKLEFKCVVMEGIKVKRWENFPNEANRKYKARYLRTILKGTENDDGGKEFIEEKGFEEESPKKPKKPEIQIDPSPRKSQIKCSMGSDLGLNEDTAINRPMIGSLNPLEGDVESEDSNNSSFLESGFIEGSPPPKKPMNLAHLQDKLDEIASVQSSESLDGFDLNGYNSPLKPRINFSMVFKKMRDRLFKKKPKTPLKPFVQHFTFEDKTNSEKPSIDTHFMEKYFKESDNMLVVCKFLPIKLFKQEGEGTIHAQIIKDSNQFYLTRHLLNGTYKKVLCVGMLRDYVGETDRDEVRMLLRKSFNCLPIFLNYDVKEMFLLSHEIFSMLDSLMTLSNYSKSQTIDKFWGRKHSAWDVLSQINEQYCQVLQQFKASEFETILISDYHLILTPKLLRQQGFTQTIGFYFNANFPTFEVFRLFPFKDDFIEGLIATDLIYFNCYEQARPFFTALSLERNVKTHSKTGLFYFTHQRKSTFIKLKSVTIDSQALKALSKDPLPIKAFTNPDCNVILGLDRISELTGVDLKMRFLAQWAKETKNKHHVKLVQILQKPYYGPLSEKQKVWLENIRLIEKELNSQFDPENPVIELYELDPNEQESLYLMSKAKVLINGSVKNEYCIDSMKFVLANENAGHVLISEFMNYNRSCGSIFSFNPLKYSDFREKLESLFKMQPQVSKDLLQADVAYLLKYPIDSWFSEFFADIKSINLLKKGKPEEIEISLPILPMFHLHTFAQDYQRSNNRVFIFEFFGSLVRSTPITDLNRFSKKSSRRTYQLNEKLMTSLRLLAQDERNTVYVITSKSANNLDIALGGLSEIGLAAESGYLYKLKGHLKWSKLITIDWSWKEVVRKNMENYTKNTFGSTLEIKESALVWNYEDAASELAQMQSKSLLSHLKSSLEKIKDVEIVIGNKCIEARPVGISKGNFVKLLLQSYQKINDIDFIMVMGADKGTFATVRDFIKNKSTKGQEELMKKYLIWVGQNKTEGDYLLKGNEEVGELMKKLGEVLFF